MMARRDLGDLIEVSRRYGSDARYVLVGGGNTSVKEGDDLYVKASGFALGTITEQGFVRMSLSKLNLIWDKGYPVDKKMREQQVLADMMAARCEGETARPSVEALLHGLIPFAFVVHLHPAIVNGITCAQSGEAAVRELFPEALWIPLVNPGYILAKIVRDASLGYEKKHGYWPQMIFLQNHGVFVAAKDVQGIEALYDRIMERAGSHVMRKPVFLEAKADETRMGLVKDGLSRYYPAGTTLLPLFNRELQTRLQNAEAFHPISSSFTPDHIVYSGFAPVWIGEEVFAAEDPREAVAAACRAFEMVNGVVPKIVAVQKTCVFATSENALNLYLDTIKVAAFAESFGGPRFMDDDQIDFIRTWEVESYRSKLAK